MSLDSLFCCTILQLLIFVVNGTLQFSPAVKELFENDICKAGNPPWVCKNLLSCPADVKVSIKGGGRHLICGFTGAVPIVCCPGTGLNKTLLDSKKVNKPTPALIGTDQSEPGGSQISGQTTIGSLKYVCSDSTWACKKLVECPSVLSSVKKDKDPEICGFAHRDLIVCCPPDKSNMLQTDNKTGIKSQMMCKQYAKSVFHLEKSPVLLGGGKLIEVDRCNRLETPLIVGGEKTKPREFPHMAQIGFGGNNDTSMISWLCGGSLISERYVLTAAHCTNAKDRGFAQWVRLGDHDISRDDDDAQLQVIRIVSRTNHPSYTNGALYNDIALFKLEKDATFSAYVRPICLPTDSNVIGLTRVIATGWGRTHWGGSTSNVLLKVALTVVDFERCSKAYKPFINPAFSEGIMSSQLCAGDADGKDTCQGDSGGPLQIPLRDPYCMYALIGVTSFGKECGSVSTPGVYTRVLSFLPWIESVVWH